MLRFETAPTMPHLVMTFLENGVYCRILKKKYPFKFNTLLNFYF